MAYDKRDRFPNERIKEPELTYYQNQIFDPIKENKHPFNSSAERKTLTLEPTTHALYYAEAPSKHISNCPSLQSKVQRFPYQDSGKDDMEEILCNCGYDSHTPQDNACTCETEKTTDCHGRINRRLFVGPPPKSKYPGVGSGLSAPHKTDFGFESLPDGTLRRIFIPQPEPCPPLYDTRGYCTDHWLLGYQYRGFKWSERTAKRFSAGSQDFPGPSDYNVTYDFCPDDKCAQLLRSSRRKRAKSLRYMDVMLETSIRNNIPGPAHYTPKKVTCPGPPILGPKDDRFKDSYRPSPGPGDYDIKRSFEPPDKVRSNFVHIDRLMDIAPFGGRAPRFKDHTSISPGPIYEPFAGFPHCNKNCSKAPFGRTERRFKCDVPDPEESSDEEYVPPCPNKQPILNECHNITWPFRSRTKRFKDSSNKFSSSPAYSIGPSHQANRYPHLQYEAPFFSSQGRFRRWYGFPPIKCEITPGPGAYNLQPYNCYPAVVAGPLFRANRFKSNPDTPAPNEYTVTVDGVLKTHNLQLKNNIDKKYKFVHKVRPTVLPYSTDEQITILMEKAAEELVPYPEPVDPDAPVEPKKKSVQIEKPKATPSSDKMLRTFLNMRSVPKYF